MKPLHELTVAQIQQQLIEKKFSSREITQHYLNRIDTLNSNYNCYITVDTIGALAAADQADQAIAAGSSAPLLGVPIAHKDIFCTEGLATTCGSKMLANFVSPYDATVVSKMKAAGAVMLGKTNMDEFAMGSSNETSFFEFVVVQTCLVVVQKSKTCPMAVRKGKSFSTILSSPEYTYFLYFILK